MWTACFQTLDSQAGPWVTDSFDTTSTQELLEKKCVLQVSDVALLAGEKPATALFGPPENHRLQEELAEHQTIGTRLKTKRVDETGEKRLGTTEQCIHKKLEMKRFVFVTNSILNEMRQRVADLVEETTRQRQVAENEEELCRVKREF
ncbi:hypothetical protein SESBI_31741 [Sesbania bispinosa]|nr:hypothetical protein SESBI_31741 [Sesbania bispinosa]